MLSVLFPGMFESNLLQMNYELADLYRSINDAKKAEECYQEALEIGRRFVVKRLLFPAPGFPDYEPFVATICNDLGVLYWKINRFQEAAVYLQEALEIRRKFAGRNPGLFLSKIADTCNDIGGLYCKTNHYKEAEQCYQEALEIYKELSVRKAGRYEAKLAMAYNNLSIVYEETGRYELAEDGYQKALAIRKNYRRKTLRSLILIWQILIII